MPFFHIEKYTSPSLIMEYLHISFAPLHVQKQNNMQYITFDLFYEQLLNSCCCNVLAGNLATVDYIPGLIQPP